MAEEVESVAPVAEKEEAAPAEGATPEDAAQPVTLNLRSAVRAVLKQALAHDGLARGLHECAKALDRGQAYFCLLAQDCDEPAYVKLVEALCAARHITLIRVPDGNLLGEWAGLCKYNKAGVPCKIVKCSCVVVRNVGKESSPAIAFLNEQLKHAETAITIA